MYLGSLGSLGSLGQERRGAARIACRGAALGMGGLLVGEGGADGEAGGDSACNSLELQLVGVLPSPGLARPLPY